MTKPKFSGVGSQRGQSYSQRYRGKELKHFPRCLFLDISCNQAGQRLLTPQTASSEGISLLGKENCCSLKLIWSEHIFSFSLTWRRVFICIYAQATGKFTTGKKRSFYICSCFGTVHVICISSTADLNCSVRVYSSILSKLFCCFIYYLGLILYQT